MEIIPAIDIIEGKCGRLIKGDFKKKKIYSSDPLRVARLFQKAGFKKLHLIDLDGAKEGKIKNWQTIKKIAKNTNFLLQVGGGLRTEKDINKLLNFGVDQVHLGTVAVCSPEKLKKFLKKFGKEKITADIGIKNGKIYFHGWQKKTEKDIKLFFKDLTKFGIKTIILTDIERDGILMGPNFSLYKKIVNEFPNLEIIASGGIRDKKDLEKLSKIGVVGAIIGRAFYEKKIKISELKDFL